MKPAILIPDFVNSIDLASIKRDRAKLARLRSQWETLGGELHERELAVIEAIEAGVPVDGVPECLCHGSPTDVRRRDYPRRREAASRRAPPAVKLRLQRPPAGRSSFVAMHSGASR